MTKEIEYVAGARADFDESFDWYAKRSEDAAIGFAWRPTKQLTKSLQTQADSQLHLAGAATAGSTGIHFASCSVTNRIDWLLSHSHMLDVGLDTGMGVPELTHAPQRRNRSHRTSWDWISVNNQIHPDAQLTRERTPS